MSILPASTTATSSTATEGDVKSFLTGVRQFISDFLGTDTSNKVAALTLLGSALNSTVSKTTNYTVVSSDRGKVLKCTGNLTINVTSASSLADGFVFAVWNSGTGVITIDPNLSEQIDGANTKQILPGKFALVYCDGLSFATVGSIGFLDLLAMGGDSGVNYRRLPGGLIVQWGSSSFATYSVAPTVCNFPIEFPNSCFYVDARASSATAAHIYCTSKTNTSFSGSNSSASSVLCDWIAFGY